MLLFCHKPLWKVYICVEGSRRITMMPNRVACKVNSGASVQQEEEESSARNEREDVVFPAFSVLVIPLGFSRRQQVTMQQSQQCNNIQPGQPVIYNKTIKTRAEVFEPIRMPTTKKRGVTSTLLPNLSPPSPLTEHNKHETTSTVAEV